MIHISLLTLSLALALICSVPSWASSRLLATSGVTQLEGGAGGGLTPWAVISGYGDEGEASVGAYYTSVDLQSFRLKMNGISASLDNRYEVSAAQQSFELKGVAGDVRQEVYGAKYRLFGDVIYSDAPQVSVGLQFKKLLDGDIADAVGARNSDSGVDYYISATKVHLAAAGGYHLLWNATLRATKANQLGLLGYGGDVSNRYQIMPEVSALVLLTDNLALGAEYRKKPDNLGAFDEDSFHDMFIAWFPNKNVNLTAAYADLGSIAASESQRGLYFSLTSWFK